MPRYIGNTEGERHMAARISTVMIRIMRAIAVAVFGFLAVMSFFFTQTHRVDEAFKVTTKPPLYQVADFVPWHLAGIAFLVLFMAGVILLERKAGGDTCLRRLEQVLAVAMPLSAGGLALVWVMGDCAPRFDQVLVYDTAHSFMENDFYLLERGHYMSLYPQQLGLIALYQCVLFFFPQSDYHLIQYIHCVFTAGIFYMLYALMRECGLGRAGRLFFLVLTPFLCPIWLYACFVYGEIPSIFGMLICIYGLWKLYDTGRIRYGALSLASGIFMLMARKNALIVVLAALIFTAVANLREKHKYLLLTLAIIILPVFVSGGVEKMYGRVSGQDVGQGIPYLAWIAMGISEDHAMPGWFDNSNVDSYYENNMDVEACKRDAWEKIKYRLNLFWDQKIEGISFYKRKICTQWNDPTYNARNNCMDGSSKITVWARRHGDGLVSLLSVVQMLLYTGVVLYAWRASASKNQKEDMFLIFILGGFFFSVIWEADSRYVLPYYVGTVPCAMKGWELAVESVIKKGNRFFKRN